MIPRISKEEYQIKLGVLLLAVLTPILCLSLHGYQPSLSSYWRTEMQPLFIITNALTSYYLFSIKSWKPSALLLLLLTSFSVEMYNNLHNGLAIIFFLITIYPLWISNHFRWLFWIYLGCMVVFPFNMLIAEIIAIWTLCLYHGLILNKVYKLNQNKDEK